MRVCVIGAGVIGSIFAGHLAQVADVSVLTRRRDHADALNADGLRISGRSELESSVTAASDPADLEPFDVGIVATKVSLGPGGRGRWKAASPTRRSSPCSTGWCGGGRARARRLATVSGVTGLGTKHSDTHVQYVLDTETWLGPYEETPFTRVEEIGDLIARPGLKVEVLLDLRPAQWSKLIFNATVNSVAALTGLRHDHHFADEEAPTGPAPRARPRRRGCARRGGGGNRAPRRPVGDELATRRGSAHYLSMLEDVDASKTEIDLITGALVREAAKHDVPVAHGAVPTSVKAKEDSW